MKKQSVFMLDGGGNLGEKVLHSLAITCQYSIIVLTPSTRTRLSYSRHCTVNRLQDWSWSNSPDKLDRYCPTQQRALLLPITLKAVTWVTQHRAYLAEHWILPALPQYAHILLASDKLQLATFLGKLSIETPTVCAVTEYPQHCHRFTAPLLLKPKRGEGGKGIVYVADIHTAPQHIAALRFPLCFFTQQYIAGTDVSHGVFCKHGEIIAAVAYRCVSRKEQFGTFSSIQIVDDPKGLAIVKKIMQHLSWNGIANLDLRAGIDEKIYVLDLNPRLWGNVRSVLVSGLNFPHLLCQDAMGNPVQRTEAIVGGYHDDIKTSLRMLLSSRQQAGITRISYKTSALRWLLFDPLCTLVNGSMHIINKATNTWRISFARGKEATIKWSEL